MFLTFFASAQEQCSLSINGTVIDEYTDTPLSFVNVTIQEINQGVSTDEDGTFFINNLCPGHYHLSISHIGCDPKLIHLDLDQDTTLHLFLAHTPVSLDGVVIAGKSGAKNIQAKSTIGKQLIEDNIDSNVSELLERETGVTSLKNGNNVAKPVVHGLFGNRLTIMYNGVEQAGQQWGNDHSPEIDPLIANRLTVIKGASALEFGGANFGSVVLVEPRKIGREPHLHGRLGYSFASNGRGHNANLKMQQFTPLVAWRINGTFKRYGDGRAPNYFLNNTGFDEYNFAIQLEKSFKDKLFTELYVSTFNSRLGILRGSHIGNLTDLETALTSSIPFFTEPAFSYELEAPSQEVHHHFFKLNSKYYLSESKQLEFSWASQINDRKELDVRRSGRSDIPALSLLQYTNTIDVKYKQTVTEGNIKIGSQNVFINNSNEPGTGILPLIPNYFSARSGVYGILNRNIGNLLFEMALRYDFVLQNVATINSSREIVNYENRFHNLAGATGISLKLSNTQSLSINTGYAMRNPAINELYSNGLHQGVSGIEEGSIDLNTERSWKTTLEYKLLTGSDFSLESLIYFQRIGNYIFLEPQDEVRLTIRGAFPVFKYTQTEASISGFDLNAQYSFTNSLIGNLKYSYTLGNDMTNDVSLINIPAANIFNSFTYRFNKSWSFSNARIENVEIEWNNRYVFKQSRVLEEQDFTAVPAAYFLTGLRASFNQVFSKYTLRYFFKLENALDTKYRDYLNRQRYFADDLGRNFSLGISLKF